MTYEKDTVDALLRKLDRELIHACAEVGRILRGAGAAHEEMLAASMAMGPVWVLLRDDLGTGTGTAHPPPAAEAVSVPAVPDNITRLAEVRQRASKLALHDNEAK